MRLVSDFTDWYDWAFDNQGPPFLRTADRNFTRREQLELLDLAGYTTPPYGEVRNVMGCPFEGGVVDKVVAYLDEDRHGGLGKALWTSQDLFDVVREWMLDEYEWMASRPCTAFVGQPGKSVRHLFVGRHKFVMEYRSDSDWRSNVNGTCRLLSFHHNGRDSEDYLPFPLYAVDLVQGRDGLYAVDLNTAPGTWDTGVERVLTATEVVKEIEDHVARRGS